MIRFCQTFLCLTVAMAAFAAQAQTPPSFAGKIPAAMTNPPPPVPKFQSPVAFFRKLLAMTPPERTAALSNRPPELRARILTKVHEYLVLDPNARELRLRATDLRWWLTPMLRMNPAQQKERLAQAPDELRPLIESRLKQWKILPPTLKDEFLDNNQALHYFTRIEGPPLPGETVKQQKIAAQFNHFFELTPTEKEQTLDTLSADERAQMEKTLKTFEHLPPRQRQLCVRNYAKFAGMSTSERARFLKSAEAWSKMSPKDRQMWRDLVAQVPIWPPMPPMRTPPVPPNLIPHPPSQLPHPGVATN